MNLEQTIREMLSKPGGPKVMLPERCAKDFLKAVAIVKSASTLTPAQKLKLERISARHIELRSFSMKPNPFHG